MKRRLATTAVLTACASACGAPADRPGAAGGPDTGYAMHRVAGNALVLPAGFDVQVYAARLPGVRMLALGPGGVPYASLTDPGLVVRLPDLNGDGDAEIVDTVATGLRHPHGLAFRGDTLYIAEEHRIIRLLPPGGRVEIVVPDLPAGGGHYTRTIVFRGDDLFVAIGSSCNLCDERDPRRAAVLRFGADGSGGERYASGLRNAVGLVVHPASGELWATNNDRDRLGDDLPPDRVNILQPGGYYGWPECYLPGVPNPEYQAAADRCEAVIAPAALLPAHTAPLGLAFYTGRQFPENYHGDLFVALHGSWDRSFPDGYKIVRIPMSAGRVAGAWEDFAVGWQVGRRWWGRPVDVLVTPDGALLVTDDFGDRVYRITYGGAG